MSMRKPLPALPGARLAGTVELEQQRAIKVYTFRWPATPNQRVAVFGTLDADTCEWTGVATTCIEWLRNYGTQYISWKSGPRDYPLGFHLRVLGPKSTHGSFLPPKGPYRRPAAGEIIAPR